MPCRAAVEAVQAGREGRLNIGWIAKQLRRLYERILATPMAVDYHDFAGVAPPIHISL
jgi:hypothetical protein